MTRLLAGLFATALILGFGFAPTLTQAQGTTEESGNAAETAEGSTKDETMMEKLEDAFKETTTPTDEETNPIGTTEDADRDLY